MIPTEVDHSVTQKGISSTFPNTNMRNHFKEYCENTGIHGLKYLTEKRSKCEKWLWLVLITTSVAACCYLIGRIYAKYDNSPVIVSFATNESEIFTIPFPAVTICPLSLTTTSELNLTKVILETSKINCRYNYETEEYVDCPTPTDSEKLNTQYLSLLCEEANKFSDQNDTFTDKLFEAFDECKVLVVKKFCKFMGDPLYKCSTKFSRTILDQGLCYTFNMISPDEIFRDNVIHHWQNDINKTSEWDIDNGYIDASKVDAFPRRALHSGAENGFKIMLEQDSDDVDYMCVEDVQGYKVTVHPPYSVPSPKMQYFYVPFGTAVAANIHPKMMTTSDEVKTYDPVDRQCYLSKERSLKYFKIYSAENCRLECLTNYTLNICGCVNFYMPREKTEPICGNNKLECMVNASRSLRIGLLEKMANNGTDDSNAKSCDCMPLCTDLSYDVEQSQSDWNANMQVIQPSRKLVGVLYIDEETYYTFSPNVEQAKLTVYFKNGRFMRFQRNELYGPIDFLANFGGLLGLFTGFSVLSLAEIIYFLTVRIFFNVKRNKVSEERAK